MNGKEIVFLVLLGSATGVAGYTWSEKHANGASTTSSLTTKETPIKPMQVVKPNVKPGANPADQEQVGARHILVQYQGSMRAAPTVTRTKEEAKALAEKVLLEVKAPGADFAALVGKYSDEPNAGARR